MTNSANVMLVSVMKQVRDSIRNLREKKGIGNIKKIDVKIHNMRCPN
jgi:hypothetical protein